MPNDQNHAPLNGPLNGLIFHFSPPIHLAQIQIEGAQFVLMTLVLADRPAPVQILLDWGTVENAQAILSAMVKARAGSGLGSGLGQDFRPN